MIPKKPGFKLKPRIIRTEQNRAETSVVTQLGRNRFSPRKLLYKEANLHKRTTTFRGKRIHMHTLKILNILKILGKHRNRKVYPISGKKPQSIKTVSMCPQM